MRLSMPPAAYHAEIAALQARLIMAEAERDGSATRDQARHTDACARIDQLARQLWDLRLARLRELEPPPGAAGWNAMIT